MNITRLAVHRKAESDTIVLAQFNQGLLPYIFFYEKLGIRSLEDWIKILVSGEMEYLESKTIYSLVKRYKPISLTTEKVIKKISDPIPFPRCWMGRVDMNEHMTSWKEYFQICEYHKMGPRRRIRMEYTDGPPDELYDAGYILLPDPHFYDKIVPQSTRPDKKVARIHPNPEAVQGV